MSFKLSKKFGLFVNSILLIILIQSCRDVPLEKPREVAKKIKISGVVCTQTPKKLDVLHRFVFFIDNTLSISGVDPADLTTRRIDGLRKLIEDYKEDDNFIIAIGTLFGGNAGFLPGIDTSPGGIPLPTSNCLFLKPRIPEDYAQIQLALDHLDLLSQNAAGNTVFEEFFNKTENCIKSASDSDEGNYNVVVVTDGAPTDLTSREVENRVTDLIELEMVEDTPGSESRVNLFLYFVEEVNANPDAAILIYKAILAAHQAGGLRSKSIVKDDDSPITYNDTFFFERFKYRLKKFFVINHNAGLLKSGLLLTDSDGDGIPDEDEEGTIYDPLKHSTFGDCSDLIHKNNGGACPMVCLAGQQFVDSDHDGLSDCDDFNLGSSAFDFDHDKDGIPDGLELRIGTYPLDTDADQDYDNDGLTAAYEAARQTSVAIDDRTVTHKTLTDISVNQVDDIGGESCYQIKVEGLPLFPTQEVLTLAPLDIRHDADANTVEFMFLQVPENLPTASPSLLYSYKYLYYSDFINGVLEDYRLSDDDFTLYRAQ